jgi:hypothetical protein
VGGGVLIPLSICMPICFPTVSSLPPSLPPSLLTKSQQHVHGSVDGPVERINVWEEGQDVGGGVRGLDFFVKGVGFLVWGKGADG